jgi:predicted dehydrogenase
MLRVGIIGVGKMGLLHFGIVNSFEGVRVEAVADPVTLLPSAIKTFQPELKVFKEAREMLAKAELDVVFITTPVFLHVEEASLCLEKGLAVFVEKPLAANYQEARTVCDRLGPKPPPNMVGFMLRFNEVFAKLKEILERRLIGDIHYFKSSTYVAQLFKPGKGWRYEKKTAGGGVLMGQSIHLLDLLLWYFGEPVAVSAKMNRWYSKEVEDHAHCWIDFAGGFGGYVDSSWSARNSRVLTTSLEIHGSRGMITADDDLLQVYCDADQDGFPSGWTSFSKPQLFQPAEIDIAGPHYTREDRLFIDAVRNGAPIPTDFRYAMKLHQMIDAIYRAAQEERTIRV